MACWKRWSRSTYRWHDICPGHGPLKVGQWHPADTPTLTARWNVDGLGCVINEISNQWYKLHLWGICQSNVHFPHILVIKMGCELPKPVIHHPGVFHFQLGHSKEKPSFPTVILRGAFRPTSNTHKKVKMFQTCKLPTLQNWRKLPTLQNVRLLSPGSTKKSNWQVASPLDDILLPLPIFSVNSWHLGIPVVVKALKIAGWWTLPVVPKWSKTGIKKSIIGWDPMVCIYYWNLSLPKTTMERERCSPRKAKTSTNHPCFDSMMVSGVFRGTHQPNLLLLSFSGHNHSSLGWSYMNKLSMDPCGLLNWFNHRLHLMARLLKSIGRLGQYVDGFPGIYHVSDAGQEGVFVLLSFISIQQYSPLFDEVTSKYKSSPQTNTWIKIYGEIYDFTEDDCHGGCVPLHCSVPGPRGTEKRARITERVSLEVLRDPIPSSPLVLVEWRSSIIWRRGYVEKWGWISDRPYLFVEGGGSKLHFWTTPQIFTEWP